MSRHVVDDGGMSDTLEPFTILGLAFTKTRTVAGGAVVRAGQTVTVEYTAGSTVPRAACSTPLLERR